MQDNIKPYSASSAYRLEAAFMGLERAQALMNEAGILNYKIEGDFIAILHYLQCNIDYLQSKGENASGC